MRSDSDAVVVAMTKTRGERLRAARKNRFKSARAAALAMGIPVSTYGAHERAELPGGRDYGPDEARRYALRFDVTPEWLLTGLREGQTQAHSDAPFPPEQSEEPPKYPVVGYVGAGSQTHYYKISPGYLDQIEPNSYTHATLVFQIRDRCLGSIFNRWLLVVDEICERVTPDLLGRLCIVRLANGDMVLRRLQPGRTEGRYDLIAEAGATFRDVSVIWVAKIKSMLPPPRVRA
jgi:hypothetical protein